MKMDDSYRRLRRRISGRRGLRAWLGFLAACPGLAATVAVAGLFATAAIGAVPYLFERFRHALDSQRADDAWLWAGILIGAYLLAVVIGWIKERAELKLVISVRFLAFRIFFDEAISDGATDGHSTGRFTTHPLQISQFSYVIDLVISLLRALVVGTFAIVTYGATGWVALGGILIFVGATFWLVHPIGRVYKEYIASEASRVDRIRDLSDAAWRLRLARLHGHVADWLQERRSAQIPVLHKRARLQVINGSLGSAAVPVVIGIAALVFVARPGRQALSLVALLVAANLLFDALNEVVVNYRVVRLTIPMLKEWDKRRDAQGTTTDTSVFNTVDGKPGITWLEPVDDDTAAELRSAARAIGVTGAWGRISADPRMSAAVLTAWYESLSEEERDEIQRWMSVLELPADLNMADSVSRLPSLSRGERHRLALAVALTVTGGPCIIETTTLGAIDPASRRRLLERVVMAKRRIVVVGQAIYGIRVDQHLVVTRNDRILVPTDSTMTTGGSAEAAGVLAAAPGQDNSPHAKARQEPKGVPVPGEEPEHSIPENKEPAAVSERHGAEDVQDVVFDTPRPSFSRFVEALRLILGRPGVAALCVTVLAQSLLLAFLPMILDAVAPADDVAVARALGLFLVALTAVVLAVNWLQFHLPVRRLTSLHARVAERFALVASPRRTGEIVGRFGEDFSTMQMDIPGQLVRVVAMVTQVVVVIGALAVGYPPVAVVVVVLVPGAFMLYRLGERRMIAAVSQQAEARGTFMALATAVLDDDPGAIHPRLRAAAWTAYRREEAVFFNAANALVQAMMRRRTELQAAGVAVFALGTGIALQMDPEGIIAPTVVAYFVFTIAGQLPDIIEALQSISVSVATASRVLALTTAQEASIPPVPLAMEIQSRLERAVLGQKSRLVLVMGRTGVGKSIALRGLLEETGGVLLDDDFPVKTISVADAKLVVGTSMSLDGRMERCEAEHREVGELTRSERQRLLASYALTVSCPLVVLDESLSALPMEEQRTLIGALRDAAQAKERSFIVVSHTNTESELFDDIVRV
ncbi:hypothetical protein [Actinobaculum sp. 313]|uniref:hypothetical protein n=1 Tax=Actinobaculum sp. 313 TaxID=2495645 RepID=UPI0013DE480A|nr:hypothetical protein [Actinobaculum sp. 313]